MSWVRRVLARGVTLVICATLLVVPAVGGEADDSVVVLTMGDSTPHREVTEGFQKYMRQHRPDATVDLYTLSDKDRAEVLDKLRRTPPSVLLTLGSAATTLALAAVPDTPIVAGLILDLAPVRKARNATGVGLEFPLETSLAWIGRILPEHKAVGVLYDPAHNQGTVEAANAVASGLDLELLSESVATPRDLRIALDQLARRTDVLWGIPDSTVLSPQTAQQVLLFSFRQQIPFVGLSAAWVKAGALYALDRDYSDVGAQCGGLTVKILGGTPPHALPPQKPRTVLYDVNLKTAKQLNISLPPDVIDGAREVIQ